MLPAFIMALALASCEKSDKEPWNPDAPTISNGAYVLNQGNSYNHIEGSLNVIDYTNFTSSLSVFKGANGRTLGDTPAVRCGLRYKAVYRHERFAHHRDCGPLKLISH